MDLKYLICGLSLFVAAPAFAMQQADSPSSASHELPQHVLIQAFVDGSGRAVSAYIKRGSGSPEADAKAMAALKKHRFRPHLVNGVGVGGQVLVPVVVEPGAKPIEA